MTIIKLSATDSTNTFLKQIASAEKLDDYTCVTAEFQTNGRGQMGCSWNSESSKNLTFSVFKSFTDLQIEHQFFLSIVTSLAVIKTLKKFDIPKLQIKWPNDILSEKKKLCGILIENNSFNKHVKSSIIGIGINVNQTVFNHLPKASSMKLVTGKTYVLDDVLSSFIVELKNYMTLLEAKNFSKLSEDYHSYLFRKDKPSMFKDSSSTFPGFIKEVSNSGHLVLTLEDQIEKSYNIKEIELLY